MSSTWLPNIRKFSLDPFASRFNSLAAQLAQYDAHNTQLETTDLPNAIHVDGGLLQFKEQATVISRPTSAKSFLSFEPDLNHLTVWFTFESWTDSVKDLSFFGNDGIISSHISIGASNGPDKGFGLTMAYGFDGIQQNINVLDNPTIQPVSNVGSFTSTSFKNTSFTIAGSSLGFSIATLIYPSTFSPVTQTGANRYIFSKVNDFNNMYTGFFDTNGVIHFWVYSGGVNFSVMTTNSVFPATWNWIVFTWNNSNNTASIYLNGVLQTTTADSPTEAPGILGDFAHAPTDLFIGSSSGGDGFLQGFMSDFRYYHEMVLQPPDVTALSTNYWSITPIPFGQVALIGLGTINPGPNTPILQSIVFRAPNTQYVDCGSNGALKVGEIANSAGTYSAWFKTNGHPTTSIGIYSNSSAAPGMAPYVNTSGFLNCDFNFNTHAADFSSTSVDVTDNKWHHVVCSNNSTGNSKLYLDGILKVNDANGDFLKPTGASSFRIGEVYGGDPFNGQIADLKIFNQELTQSEVTNLFNGIDVTRARVVNFKMTEGVGTTITDTDNGVVGTLTNGPIWLSDAPPGAV